MRTRTTATATAAATDMAAAVAVLTASTGGKLAVRVEVLRFKGWNSIVGPTHVGPT